MDLISIAAALAAFAVLWLLIDGLERV